MKRQTTLFIRLIKRLIQLELFEAKEQYFLYFLIKFKENSAIYSTAIKFLSSKET